MCFSWILQGIIKMENIEECKLKEHHDLQCSNNNVEVNDAVARKLVQLLTQHVLNLVCECGWACYKTCVNFSYIIVV